MTPKRLWVIYYGVFLALALWIARSYIGTPAHPYPVHDSLFIEFTYRAFLAKWLHDGIFPLWDHWGNCGLATGANPVGTILFSPIFWLMSAFGKYSLDRLVLEMLVILSIGFVGMSLWLGNFTKDHLIRAYGAFCFVISCPVLATMGNFSTVATFMLSPLLAVALQGLFEGKRHGIPLTVLTLSLLFGHGYPGLNAVFVPVLLLYCGVGASDLWGGLKRLGVSLILLAMIESFPLAEMWTSFHFKFTTLRPAGFSPMEGSAAGAVLYSLFFANTPLIFKVFPTMDPTGFGYLYFGAINLVFALAGILASRRERNTKWLALFWFSVFLMMLNKAPGEILTQIFLPLKLTRWHSWLNGLFVFFGISLSAIGLESVASARRPREVLMMSLGFILFLTVLLRTIFETEASLSLIWVGATAAMIAVVFVAGFRWRKMSRAILVLALVFLGTAEIGLQGSDYRTYRDVYGKYYGGKKDEKSILSIYGKSTPDEWPLPKDLLRIRSSAGLFPPEPVNLQYLNGRPALESYSPALSTAVKKIYEKGPEESLRVLGKMFQIDTPNGSAKIELRLFEPNRMELEVSAEGAPATLLWTSPFSENWKVTDGNAILPTRPSQNGLTVIDVQPGKHDYHFNYRPPYLWPTVFLALLGYFALVAAWVRLPFIIFKINGLGRRHPAVARVDVEELVV